MPIPTTRQGLIDYCLRKLGSDVVEINISVEQIEDRIDDALLYFQDFHFDGVEQVYLVHQMTAPDIVNQYIQIPPPVISVTGVVPYANELNASNLFNIEYQLRLNDLYSFTSTSIIYYDIMQKHLALLNFEFNTQASILFTRHQQQLRIMMDWNLVCVGDYYIIECYRILDPNTYPDIYNDRFLKMYATALIKQQWGTNLQKYAGVALIGGVQLNGTELYSQATQEIATLEELVQTTYVLPVQFYMG